MLLFGSILNLFYLLCFETFDTYLSFHSVCQISWNILNVSNYSAGMAVSGAILLFSPSPVHSLQTEVNISTCLYCSLPGSLFPHPFVYLFLLSFFICNPLISWYVLLPLCIFPHFITVPLLPL